MAPTVITDGLGFLLLLHRAFHFHPSDAVPCVVSILQPFLCCCDRTQCHTQRMASASPWTTPVHRRERHLFLCQGVMSILLPTCNFHCRSLFACRSATILPEDALSVAQGSFLCPHLATQDGDDGNVKGPGK